MKSLLSILVLPLLLTGPARSAERGPSTPEERQKAVELVKVLETAPWSDEAREARAWLTTFLDEAPDITVKKCLSLLGSAPERQGIPADLQMQAMFSSAAYILQHPGAGAGSTETFVAGLEGTLKSYSALRVTAPSRRSRVWSSCCSSRRTASWRRTCAARGGTACKRICRYSIRPSVKANSCNS